MTKEEYKYSELTGKVIGCAMEVHTILGNGFQEVIYQRAMAKEMTLRNISFSREHDMEIMYKGESLGTRRVDFLVEGFLSVELKAHSHRIDNDNLRQGLNYLEIYHLEIGLLINFGGNSLEFRRLINSKFKS